MSGSGFWIFSQLAFRNVWHWNSPGLTVLCSKMWAWKEAEKIQELGKDTRAEHTSRCTEKDKSVWKTYLHAPPLACLSRRLTKHTQVKRILLSMLLFSAHLTQLLNIKRNHDQMSVSSSYCEHPRLVFHKSQGPEVVQKGGLWKCFFQGHQAKVLLERTPRKSPGLAISVPLPHPSDHQDWKWKSISHVGLFATL